MYRRCLDIVSPILQALRNESQRQASIAYTRSTSGRQERQRLNLVGSGDWLGGEKTEVTRVALAEYAPHMLV